MKNASFLRKKKQHFFPTFVGQFCSTSCVLSSTPTPPSKKKMIQKKRDEKIHHLQLQLQHPIPRPDPLEQPVVIITGNTEAPFWGPREGRWGGRCVTVTYLENLGIRTIFC